MMDVKVFDQKTTFGIDGYSSAKTAKGAIKDLAKQVIKFSQAEANNLIENINDIIPILNQRNGNDEYFVDCEYIGTGYYIGIRFVK